MGSGAISKRLVLAYFVFSSLTPAFAAESRCARLLSRAREVRTSLIEHAREVRESNGVRLIIKDAEPPRGRIYRHFVQRPSWAISQAVLGRRVEPTNWITVPAALALGMLTWGGYAGAYNYELRHKIEHSIEVDAPEYDKLIASDFRYHAVKEDLENGLITKEQARQGAYELRLAYRNYYDYRAKHLREDGDLKSQMWYLNQTLFLPLKQVIEKGVTIQPGYGLLSGERGGPLSSEEKLRLFRIYHGLFLKYQIIDELIGGTQLFQRMQGNPHFAAQIGTLLNDPFTKKILELNRQGRIDSSKARWFLQRDAYWKALFDELETVGLAREKLDQDGRPTGETLTLNDIRKEVLDAYN